MLDRKSNNWLGLVGCLGMVLLLPGCFTANLLGQQNYRSGTLGEPAGVFVAEAGSVTVLVPRDDTQEQRMVGLHAGPAAVEEAIGHLDRQPLRTTARLRLDAKPGRADPQNLVLTAAAPAIDFTRADIETQHGPGRWVEFTREPPAAWDTKPTEKLPLRNGQRWWAEAEIGGRSVPLQLVMEAGFYPHKTFWTEGRKVLLLPVAIFGDVVVGAALVVVLPVALLIDYDFGMGL